MGAGPGLVGLVAASLGADVTLTDRCSAVLTALRQSTKAVDMYHNNWGSPCFSVLGRCKEVVVWYSMVKYCEVCVKYC